MAQATDILHPITQAQLAGQGLKLDTVKRGINLGCGRVILPCDQPAHHHLLPADLYAEGAYEWDNVDVVRNEGVTNVINLFDYPWREVNAYPDLMAHRDRILPDDTYDVAIATHLCEHIPHAVKRNGVVTDTHGGWWAWWDELGRVLKPGGVAHILVPYGLSRGGLMDPTHTRYLLPETFGYFQRNPDAPFDYPLKYEWEATGQPTMGFTPLAFEMAETEEGEITPVSLWKVAQKYVNAISEFTISLRVLK
jgi:SAM-dependent methyltransferase